MYWCPYQTFKTVVTIRTTYFYTQNVAHKMYWCPYQTFKTVVTIRTTYFKLNMWPKKCTGVPIKRLKHSGNYTYHLLLHSTSGPQNVLMCRYQSQNKTAQWSL